MQLLPFQMVLLIAGPAGSGKTTIASKIAGMEGWDHISEDDVWNEIGHPSNQPRNDNEQKLVHVRVHELILQSLQSGKSVVVEFILFHKPPKPLLDYQSFLAESGIPFETRVLRPSLETILLRAGQRGRETDLNDADCFKSNALHQLDCASSVDPGLVIDTSGDSLQVSFDKHFQTLVEKGSNHSHD